MWETGKKKVEQVKIILLSTQAAPRGRRRGHLLRTIGDKKIVRI